MDDLPTKPTQRMLRVPFASRTVRLISLGQTLLIRTRPRLVPTREPDIGSSKYFAGPVQPVLSLHW